MTANGVGNGHIADMTKVFPEAHLPLSEADPELYSIIEDEKKRQWYVVCNAILKSRENDCFCFQRKNDR